MEGRWHKLDVLSAVCFNWIVSITETGSRKTRICYLWLSLVIHLTPCKIPAVQKSYKVSSACLLLSYGSNCCPSQYRTNTVTHSCIWTPTLQTTVHILGFGPGKYLDADNSELRKSSESWNYAPSTVWLVTVSHPEETGRPVIPQASIGEMREPIRETSSHATFTEPSSAVLSAPCTTADCFLDYKSGNTVHALISKEKQKQANKQKTKTTTKKRQGMSRRVFLHNPCIGGKGHTGEKQRALWYRSYK